MAFVHLVPPPLIITTLLTLSIILWLSLRFLNAPFEVMANFASSIRQRSSRKLQQAFDTVTIKIISWFPDSKLCRDRRTLQDMMEKAPGWYLFITEMYLGDQGHKSRITEVDLDAPDAMRKIAMDLINHVLYTPSDDMYVYSKMLRPEDSDLGRRCKLLQTITEDLAETAQRAVRARYWELQGADYLRRERAALIQRLDAAENVGEYGVEWN